MKKLIAPIFPEFQEITQLTESWNLHGKVEVIATVTDGNFQVPIHAFSLGTQQENVPVLMITGGIHGLERIGTWVVISFMKHLLSRLPWDEVLQFQMQKFRMVFVPLVNPVGMAQRTRSNANGVDLMRNAPIEAVDASFGVGGHQFSPRLPWFRGNPSQTEEGMEIELKALYELFNKELGRSSCMLGMDLHSGFGMVDQLWLPYAKSTSVFENIHQFFALSELLDEVLPNHIYRFEPQSKHYTTHGDLWDYLLLKHQNKTPFLPFTLEMGSWSWVKKNPSQLFSFLGPFNPIAPHRQKRTMRRHLPLLDFLMHMMSSPAVWTNASVDLREAGVKKWY